jgi:hypothetical protein
VEKVAQNVVADHANVVNVQSVDANLANAKNKGILKKLFFIRPALAGLDF